MLAKQLKEKTFNVLDDLRRWREEYPPEPDDAMLVVQISKSVPVTPDGRTIGGFENGEYFDFQELLIYQAAMFQKFEYGLEIIDELEVLPRLRSTVVDCVAVLEDELTEYGMEQGDIPRDTTGPDMARFQRRIGPMFAEAGMAFRTLMAALEDVVNYSVFSKISQDSLVFHFSSRATAHSVAVKVTALNVIYDDWASLLGEGRPLLIEQMQAGSFLTRLVGGERILKLIDDAIRTIADRLDRRFTSVGKRRAIREDLKVIKEFVDLRKTAKEAGVTLEGMDDRIEEITKRHLNAYVAILHGEDYLTIDGRQVVGDTELVESTDIGVDEAREFLLTLKISGDV